MRDIPTSEQNLLATLDQLIDYVSDDIYFGFLEHKGVAVRAPGYLLLRLICHPILILQGTKSRRDNLKKMIADLGLISTDADGKRHLIYETEEFFRTCVNKSDKIAKILEQVRENRWLFGYHVSCLLRLHYCGYPAGNKPKLTTDFFFTKLLPLAADFMSFRAKLDEDRPFKHLYPQFMANLMQSGEPDIDSKFSGLANATDIARVNQYLLPYLIKVIDHIHSQNFDKPKKIAILDALLGAAENFFAGNLVAMINHLGMFSDLAQLKNAHLDAEAQDLGMFVREAIVRYTASYQGKESGGKQLNLEDLKIFPLDFDQITRTVDFETITAKLMSGKLPLPKHAAFPSGNDKPLTATVRATPPLATSNPSATVSPSAGSDLPVIESDTPVPSSLDTTPTADTLGDPEHTPAHPPHNDAPTEPSSSYFGSALNFGAGMISAVSNSIGYGAGIVQNSATYVWQHGRRDLGQAAWHYGVSPVGSVVDSATNAVFGDRSVVTALEECICSLAQPGLGRSQFFLQLRNGIKILQKMDNASLTNPLLYSMFIRRADEIKEIVTFLEHSPIGSRIWKLLGSRITAYLGSTIHPALASLSPDEMLTLCKKGAVLLSTLKANEALLDCNGLATLINQFLDHVKYQTEHNADGKPTDPMQRARLSLLSEPDTYAFLVEHAPLLQTVLNTFLSQRDDNDQNTIRKACARIFHQITTDNPDAQTLCDADLAAGANKVRAIAQIGSNLCGRLVSTPAVVHADSLAGFVEALYTALQTDGTTYSKALAEVAKTDAPYQLFHEHLDLLRILSDETIALSTAPQDSLREVLIESFSSVLPDRLQNQKHQLALRLQEMGGVIRGVLCALQDTPLDNEDCKKLFTTYANSGYATSSLQTSPDLYRTLLKNREVLTVACKQLAQHEEAIADAKKRNIHPNPVYFSDLIIDALPFLRDEYGIGAEDIRHAYLPILPSLTQNLTPENCPNLHTALPTFLSDLLSPPAQTISGDPHYFTDINADSLKTNIMPWLNSLIAKIVSMKDPLHSGESAQQLVKIGEDFFSQNFVGLANTFNHLCTVTKVGEGASAKDKSNARMACEFIHQALLSKFSELDDEGKYVLSNNQIRPAELDYCWKLLGISNIVSGYLAGTTKEKPGQHYKVPAPVTQAPAPKETGFWAQTKSWARFIWIRYIKAALESVGSWTATAAIAVVYLPITGYSYFLSAKRWADSLFKGMKGWFNGSSENQHPDDPPQPTSVPRETGGGPASPKPLSADHLDKKGGHRTPSAPPSGEKAAPVDNTASTKNKPK